MKRDFQLDIKVIVRDFKRIQNICKAVPDAWENNAEMKTDIMFLWQEIDSSRVLDRIVTTPQVDIVKYVPGAILWHVLRRDYSKSALPKLISTKVYKQMTVRNVNTLRKLHQMMSV